MISGGWTQFGRYWPDRRIPAECAWYRKVGDIEAGIEIGWFPRVTGSVVNTAMS